MQHRGGGELKRKTDAFRAPSGAASPRASAVPVFAGAPYTVWVLLAATGYEDCSQLIQRHCRVGSMVALRRERDHPHDMEPSRRGCCAHLYSGCCPAEEGSVIDPTPIDGPQDSTKGHRRSKAPSCAVATRRRTATCRGSRFRSNFGTPEEGACILAAQLAAETGIPQPIVIDCRGTGAIRHQLIASKICIVLHRCAGPEGERVLCGRDERPLGAQRTEEATGYSRPISGRSPPAATWPARHS